MLPSPSLTPLLITPNVPLLPHIALPKLIQIGDTTIGFPAACEVATCCLNDWNTLQLNIWTTSASFTLGRSLFYIDTWCPLSLSFSPVFFIWTLSPPPHSFAVPWLTSTIRTFYFAIPLYYPILFAIVQTRCAFSASWFNFFFMQPTYVHHQELLLYILFTLLLYFLTDFESTQALSHGWNLFSNPN